MTDATTATARRAEPMSRFGDGRYCACRVPLADEMVGVDGEDEDWCWACQRPVDTDGTGQTGPLQRAVEAVRRRLPAELVR